MRDIRQFSFFNNNRYAINNVSKSIWWKIVFYQVGKIET